MLYIDGQFRDDAQASAGHIDQALDAAGRAFVELRHWPAHRRAELLERIAAGIQARAGALATRIRDEAKKPIAYARGEVTRAISTFKFAADEARRLGGELVPMDAAVGGEERLGLVRRVPRGPVTAITPFNFPLNLCAHKIAPALACGASVVHKPAPETPETALDLARIVDEAGAPAGALNVVPCAVDVAAPLVTDPRTAVLSFTGSAHVGWQLKREASAKHTLLELGGDAAVIVEADADLDLAIPRLVIGAFAYAGQVCISVQRIFVHESLYDTVSSRLIEATKTLAVVGDPADDAVMVGPLIRSRDADRVMDWIAEAKGKGAHVLVGDRREGDTVWPTLLCDVPADAKVSCEEVFGPVAVLTPVRDLDDAIARTNRSPYGLQAGLFTHDQRKLMRAFAALEVGALVHNDVPTFRVDHMPYGGTKRSGVGREGLRYAVEEMTEPRLLVMRTS